MDYLDALRDNGWLPDPADRVAVVAAHERSCPAALDDHRPCRCVPRLELHPALRRDWIIAPRLADAVETSDGEARAC